MNPSFLSRIGAGLMGAVDGAGDPGRGLGRLMESFKRRRSQGAVLPNNPLSAQHFPVQPMQPGGFGSMPGGPNIGPGFPPDNGFNPHGPIIGPGMPEDMQDRPLQNPRRWRF